MTAFLIDGFNAPKFKNENQGGYDAHRYHLKQFAQSRKILKNSRTNNEKASANRQSAPETWMTARGRGLYPKPAIQSLIKGLSDHFNDLVMGIWGNTTLIRLNLKQGHPAFEKVLQMEWLIREGAELIQQILGFLGEHSDVGKAIHLNQLVHQIGCHLPKGYDPEQLSVRLQRGTEACQPGIVASATARVVEFLFKGIETFRRNIIFDTHENPIIQQRIGIIGSLVQRGEMITSQLLCYAGDFRLNTRYLDIRPLLLRQYRRARSRYRHLHFHKSITPRLPCIPIDQKHIEWVIAQFIENAAMNTLPGGHISLSLKPLFAESPHERCVVRGAKDYLVLTVEDNGTGMSKANQFSLFQPFFIFPKFRKSYGLGLAASQGIIKAHKGYIQVRSRENLGSKFKLYLPVEACEASLRPWRR